MSLSRWFRPAALVVAGCLLSAPLPAAAQELSDQQRQQIEGVVRDYLLKNPEILREAMTALESRVRNENIAKAKDTSENSGAIVLGNPKGDVTLVEYFDYNCGYCKRSVDDIRALIKTDPQLRVVLRDFPVLRQESVEAAIVALAASKQLSGDRYLDFHTKLIQSEGVIGQNRALEEARAAGVDLAKLKNEMGEDWVRQALSNTSDIAEQLSLTGTPSFVLGDGIIPGAVGLDTLKEAVSSVRQCGKLSC